MQVPEGDLHCQCKLSIFSLSSLEPCIAFCILQKGTCIDIVLVNFSKNMLANFNANLSLNVNELALFHFFDKIELILYPQVRNSMTQLPLINIKINNVNNAHFLHRYGNHFGEMEHQVGCMLLPKLTSINCAHFDFPACVFTERNMYLKGVIQ